MRQHDSVSQATPIMTLHAHLKEARTRLFIIFTVFVLFSCAAYAIHDYLLTALLAPLHGEKLAYLNPGGGFSFIFAVTMWTGLALTAPVIIYSIYRFIAPALPRKAQSRGGVILFFSYLLFLAGAAFGYFYAIPGALNFLIGFGEGFVEAMLTADAYLNFVLVYTIGLGILFQIPIIMMVIHWARPLSPLKLLQFERYVIAGAFVVAAIITPTPDVANQLVVAAPFIGMYQVGLMGISLSHLRRNRAGRIAARREVGDRVAASESQEPVAAMQPTVIERAIVTVPEATLASRTHQGASVRSIDGFGRVGSRPALRTVGKVSVPERPVRRRAAAPAVRPPQLRNGQAAMDVFARAPFKEVA